MNHKTGWLIILLLGYLLLEGCASQTPSATLTATVTIAPTITPTRLPSTTPVPTFPPTLTATRTLAPTTPATRTATPFSTLETITCPGARQSRLRPMILAQVSYEPPISNRVRSEPGTSSEIIGLLGPGEVVLVTAGPECADGYAWWQVQSLAGLAGWSTEGDETGYWLAQFPPSLPAPAAAENIVTLTARQVDGANDIEAAIIQATADGKRPGIVILDGKDGPFIYEEADHSLNLFVSNLTMQGVNQARIVNCGDGLFFEDFLLENIRVEGIEFDCYGSGVAGGGNSKNVTLRGNIFLTQGTPINVGGSLSEWRIEQNLIQTAVLLTFPAIELNGVSQVVMKDNFIAGRIGIIARQCSGLLISNNYIHSYWWGVNLIDSTQNQVEKNRIHFEHYAGIILVEQSKENQILSNTVTCAGGTGCLSVDVPPELAALNTVTGNLP